MAERPLNIESAGFKRYVSRDINTPKDSLCFPSRNTEIDQNGVVRSVKGMRNIRTLSSTGRMFKQPDINITWFTLDTVQYIKGDLEDGTIIDTGVSLSETTRMDFYNGDAYAINTIDGLLQFIVLSLNGDVSISDTSITVNKDALARLFVFGGGTGSITGTLRIAEDDYAYEFDSADILTGNMNITTAGGLTANYSDTDPVIVYDAITSAPKGKDLTFWTERMFIWGTETGDNIDSPKHTLHNSKFTLPYGTSFTDILLDNIIDFTYGTQGSLRTNIGKGGNLQTTISTEDYLHIFSDTATYGMARSRINLDNGQVSPDLRNAQYGTINADSAVAMGTKAVGFITNNNRILRNQVSTQSGEPVANVDINFDNDIREIVDLMDKEQPYARADYANNKAYFQVSVANEVITLIYDDLISAWQPPKHGFSVSAMIEDSGVVYGMDLTKPVLYAMDSGTTLDGITYECAVATAEFDVLNAYIDNFIYRGEIQQNTKIQVRHIVNGISANKKNIVGSDYSYPSGGSLGQSPLATDALALGRLTKSAKWTKKHDVSPSYAKSIKAILSSDGESNQFTVQYYHIEGRSVPLSTPQS